MMYYFTGLLGICFDDVVLFAILWSWGAGG